MNIDVNQIDDTSAQQKIKGVFEQLEKIKDDESLATRQKLIEAAFSGLLEKNYPNGNKFPRIAFNITKDDLEEISESIENFSFTKDLAKGKGLSTLEKIMYAVLWKNGDLGKESHIIRGILEKDDPESKAFVFYYFGKHLNSKTSPIIDQHVLRAFMMRSKADIESFRALRAKSIFKKEVASDYMGWHKTLCSGFKGDLNNFVYEVDRILFAVGRLLKVTNGRKSIKTKNT